ncbi:Hypothetical predicted protein, partial [Pelobates cultripes]
LWEIHIMHRSQHTVQATLCLLDDSKKLPLVFTEKNKVLFKVGNVSEKTHDIFILHQDQSNRFSFHCSEDINSKCLCVKSKEVILDRPSQTTEHLFDMELHCV